MISHKLYRVAFINPFWNVFLTDAEIIDSKQAYEGNLYGSVSDKQKIRNNRRDKLKSILLLEREVDDLNQPVPNRPFLVIGIGPNLSGKSPLDSARYYDKDNIFNKQLLLDDLFEIYYGMMLVALEGGKAKLFICPLLSSGYYAAGAESDSNLKHLKKSIITTISNESFEKAKMKFNTEHPGLIIELEMQDSLKKVDQLAQDHNLKPEDIAVGIAGADNSGTGNLCDESEVKFDNKSSSLPQEESVRYGLGGAFIDKNNYQTINSIKLLNQIQEPVFSSIKVKDLDLNIAIGFQLKLSCDAISKDKIFIFDAKDESNIFYKRISFKEIENAKLFIQFLNESKIAWYERNSLPYFEIIIKDEDLLALYKQLHLEQQQLQAINQQSQKNFFSFLNSKVNKIETKENLINELNSLITKYKNKNNRIIGLEKKIDLRKQKIKVLEKTLQYLQGSTNLKSLKQAKLDHPRWDEGKDSETDKLVQRVEKFVMQRKIEENIIKNQIPGLNLNKK